MTERDARKSLTALSAAAAAAEAKNCGKALRLARPLAEDPSAAGLNDLGAVAAWEIVARCEYLSGRADAALAAIRRGTMLDAAPDALWHLRLAYDLDTKNWTSAVETLEAMTQGRGHALNKVEQQWLWQLDGAVKDSGDKQLRLRLLKLLSDPAYAPARPLASADGFRASYADLLAEAGDGESARALVAELRSPSELARASFNPQLRPFFSSDPDLRAAWEARLDDGRRAISQHPNLLDPLIETARALRVLGRPKEALEVLRPATALIGTAGAFQDADTRLNWFHDSLARTFAALGRYEEAVASFRAGADLQEFGAPNVSQVINLAYAQFSFGHGDEALKTLGVFDQPDRRGSPYGESEMRLAKGCARAVAGQAEAAAAELAYLREHEKDHPEALPDLLLCLGDLNAAAAATIRRLEDPERRAAALLQFSDYDPRPANGPRNPIDAGLQQLKQRPDIQAALQRAGGTRRFHVQADEL